VQFYQFWDNKFVSAINKYHGKIMKTTFIEVYIFHIRTQSNPLIIS